MAPHRQYPGALQPGRTSADHHDFLLRLRRYRLQPPGLILAGHLRIHRAAYGHHFGGVLDAALVAPEALADLIHPALAGLVGQIGIGDGGPAHVHQVGLTRGHDLLCLGRVDDPPPGQHRDLHHLLDGRAHVYERVHGEVHDLSHGPLGPVGGGCHVDEVDLPGLGQYLDNLHHVVQSVAALDQLVAANAEGQGEVLAHALPDGIDHLEREPQPVLQAASVLVRPEVEERRDVLLQHVPVTGIDLKPVVTGLAAYLGGDDPVFLELLDFLHSHRVGHAPVPGLWQC